MHKVIIVFVLLVVANHGLYAQTLTDVNRFEVKYQQCSDKGVFLRGCTAEFYDQMDSLLNLAYNKLRMQLPEKERADLKAEELAWLKRRDQFIKTQKKEIEKTFESDEWDNEMYLVLDHAAAVFVKGRAVELIKKLDKLKK